MCTVLWVSLSPGTRGYNNKDWRHSLFTAARQTSFTLMADAAATMMGQLSVTRRYLTLSYKNSFRSCLYRPTRMHVRGITNDPSCRAWVEWGKRVWRLPPGQLLSPYSRELLLYHIQNKYKYWRFVTGIMLPNMHQDALGRDAIRSPAGKSRAPFLPKLNDLKVSPVSPGCSRFLSHLISCSPNTFWVRQMHIVFKDLERAVPFSWKAFYKIFYSLSLIPKFLLKCFLSEAYPHCSL